jgi:hypothetical protein
VNANPPHRSIARRVNENQFLVLLIVLVLFISVSPYLTDTETSAIVQATLMSFVLLAAIGCLQFKKRGIVTTRWFGVATLLSGWIPIFAKNEVVNLIVAGFRIGFLLIVTAALVYQVAASKRVSLPIIIGAIDGYLMIGMIGAVAFAIIDFLFPGSVKFPMGVSSQMSFTYFAYITMLTVGYGEILPVSPTAQTVAVFLAASGQLYIAILVAMLVGKFLAADQTGRTDA